MEDLPLKFEDINWSHEQSVDTHQQWYKEINEMNKEIQTLKNSIRDYRTTDSNGFLAYNPSIKNIWLPMCIAIEHLTVKKNLLKIKIHSLNCYMFIQGWATRQPWFAN